MRISDWSLDVCSSDLRARHLPHPPDRRRAAGAARHRYAGDATGGADRPRPRRTDADQQRDAARRAGADEIGRASCRERVCQYVSISVVDGTVNKKTIITNKTKTKTNNTKAKKQ